MVQAKTADGGGNESIDILSPVREIYLSGDLSNPIRKLNTVTADYTLDGNDQVVLVDATAGPVTITLQPAASMRGKTVTVTKIDATANTVTVVPDGTDLISGATSEVLTAQFESFTAISDGN